MMDAEMRGDGADLPALGVIEAPNLGALGGGDLPLLPQDPVLLPQAGELLTLGCRDAGLPLGGLDPIQWTG